MRTRKACAGGLLRSRLRNDLASRQRGGSSARSIRKCVIGPGDVAHTPHLAPHRIVIPHIRRAFFRCADRCRNGARQMLKPAWKSPVPGRRLSEPSVSACSPSPQLPQACFSRVKMTRRGRFRRAKPVRRTHLWMRSGRPACKAKGGGEKRARCVCHDAARSVTSGVRAYLSKCARFFSM